MNGLRYRESWFIAPDDVVTWSIEPKPNSAGAYLVMALTVACAPSWLRRRMITQTFITAGAVERAKSGDYRDMLYTVSEQARLMVQFRNLPEKRFWHTLNWSYNDYAKARRRS